VAEYLHARAGIEVRLNARGRIGELTVWVGDKQVVKKGFFKFPEKEAVLAAVQQQLGANHQARV